MNRKQPTILQLIPALETGGAERGCVDMAIAIQQAGGRALVVSEGGKLVTELAAAGATHIEWRTAGSKNPFHIMQNAEKLKALLQAEGVSLVHARSRAPAWAGWLAARSAGIPFMTTFHSTYNFSGRAKQFYNGVMVRGARVIAISDFIRRHIVEHYRVDDEKIRLVHRGIDIERFDPVLVPAVHAENMRAQWGVPEGARVILLVGRLTRWKGQGVLIEAMAHLRDLDVVAVCVGGDQGRTAYTEGLRALVAELGLQGRVFLPGDCAAVQTAYAAADVVVSASTEPEAFGRVIVEAQAMGKPVVVSNLGAVAETAVATGFGWVVPPADASALAAALRDVLARPAGELAARAAAARTFVAQNYTKQNMVAKTLAVYNELLPEGARFG